MSEYIIETNELSFTYKNTSDKILDAISLKVPKGSIYGFLGCNGAGKSTTMRLLTGIIKDNNNCIKIFNQPLKNQSPSLFKNVGCLIESPSLYLHLSGYDNLRYVAKMKGNEAHTINEILNLVQLSKVKNQKVKEYSLGMKQRLAIGIALLGNPKLLLLDEPINGLDPHGVIDVRNLLIKLNNELGITIFISSHLLDEVERICTHVGILSNGKLVFQNTIKTLKEEVLISKDIYLKLDNATKWFEIIEKKWSEVTIQKSVICIRIKNQLEINNLLIYLLQEGAIIKELSTNEGLENLFIHFTKNKINENRSNSF